MRIAVIDTYYDAYLKYFYKTNPDVERLSYGEHRQRLMSERFAAADAYSYYFNRYGCEAEEIVVNNGALQWAWARERGAHFLPLPDFCANGTNFLFGRDWRFKVLKGQIRTINPDVIFIKEQSILTDAMVLELKNMVGLVAMQVASPLLARRRYRGVDLVITSLPHFVPIFREMGLRSEYLKLCFDPRVLNEIKKRPKHHEVTFVGGVTRRYHQERQAMLELVAREFPLRWFGYATNVSDQGPALKKCRGGDVWGLAMYQVLADSQLTINHHAAFAKEFANNMRLFEATGVGTCLLTDAKQNIRDFFEPDEEAVVYGNREELLEKLRYLSAHPAARQAIADRGQGRTLREHTYDQVIPELIRIFKKSF
ncbi:MAG: glycosyltransferase [Candidatus Omnitrophica bacterium]|nr:glycosyltransferase [Candidatus Omnitrophota bacterium]